MKLIFLGPPGSGKGTYAKIIGPVLGLPQISTGDIFREHMKNETEIGKKIKEVMESGNLVSDEIVMEIVKSRLEKNDVKNGFIFDGFPRTLKQARELEDIIKIDAVVNLVVPEEIIIQRLTSRRVCEKCGAIFNVITLKPEKEGICDKCQGELLQRKDDTIEVVKDRLEVYKKQTEPLINYYKEKGLLLNIVNDKIDTPPEEKAKEILEKLKSVKTE